MARINKKGKVSTNIHWKIKECSARHCSWKLQENLQSSTTFSPEFSNMYDSVILEVLQSAENNVYETCVCHVTLAFHATLLPADFSSILGVFGAQA